MILGTHLLPMLPSWIYNSELQATVLLGLTCVGAWVIVVWLIQVIFSILWPFFVVVMVLMLMPQWRKMLATDFLPKYTESIKAYAERFGYYSNSTST